MPKRHSQKKNFKGILSEADTSSSCPILCFHLRRSFPLIPLSPLVPLSPVSLLLRPELSFPVLSQECQVFRPIWQLFFPSDPRLVILNVTSTSWQMSTFFIPVTPQWFPWEEARASLSPPGLPGHSWVIVLRCPPVPCSAGYSRVPYLWTRAPAFRWPMATEQLILTLRSLIKVPWLHDEKSFGNLNLGGNKHTWIDRYLSEQMAPKGS